MGLLLLQEALILCATEGSGYTCALTWCALFGYTRPTRARVHLISFKIFAAGLCHVTLPLSSYCLCKHN